MHLKSKLKYGFKLFILLFLTNAYSTSNQINIKISGIQGDVLKNVENRLQIRKIASDSQLTSNEIQAFFEQSSDDIKKALEPYGYFMPKIIRRLFKEKNTWTAYYYINPGSTINITNLDFTIEGEGQHNPKLLKILKQLPIFLGQPFSSINYTLAKQWLLQKATNAGYLKAEFKASIVYINVQHKKVQVVLHLDTGPRFYFGQVHFKQTGFSEGFLRRFLNFSKGDIYSETQLFNLQQQLSDSNFFDTVEVLPQLEQSIQQEKQYVPINIHITPKKNKHYTVGLGYGTDTGFRGLLGIKLPHITSNGQHLQSLIKGSEKESQLVSSYIIPGYNPITDQYSLNLLLDSQYGIPGRSESVKLTGNYVTSFGKLRQTLALNFLYDKSELEGATKEFNSILYPSIDWLYVSSDNPLLPTQGRSLDLTLLGASRSALSSINFFQVSARAKLIQTLARNNRFIMRGSLGYTEIADLSKLPLTLNFYAGGSRSVRGYSYRSIGPGRQILTGSFEYQRRIIRNWYFATFYDFGGVSNSFRANLQQSAGVGVVLLTSLGALELTFAKRLIRQDEHKPLLIQFSMGPEL